MKKMPNNRTNEKPRMLKVSEVAKILNVSERYVRREISEGNLPVYRFRRAIRISEEDLKRYIDGSR